MKRVVRIPAIIYVSYLALVLLVVTPALNLLPGWAVKKYLGRDFHSEFVWFNPFTLSLEMRKTAIPELDGSRFVSLDRASVPSKGRVAPVPEASEWGAALAG